MVNKKKTQKKQSKKPSKSAKSVRPIRAKNAGSRPTSVTRTDSATIPPPPQVYPPQPSSPRQAHGGPSIEIRTIDGETTIGDLIVAFPRTRDVLMKHGLRFDVEEAGYLYMTLSVFSAIHGHSTTSLVEQLVVVSKEPPAQPPVLPIRPIPTAATA